MHRYELKRKHQGFTIVELLIATSVFSVMLMLISFSLIQIGKTYTKGLTIISTQGVVRNAIDQVSQEIQFSSATPDISSPRVYCIGERQYNYDLGRQLNSSNPNVFYVGPKGGGCTHAAYNPSTMIELLGKNMRLAKFTICAPKAVTPICPSPPQAANTYSVDIRVVYGDDDLVCSPSLEPAVCNSGANTAHPDAPDLTCKNNVAGSQFCAVSELSTIVQKRTK